MQNTKLDEIQAGIKIAGRDYNNLRYADNTTLMAKKKKKKWRTKKPLEEGERGEWISWHKTQHSKS